MRLSEFIKEKDKIRSGIAGIVTIALIGAMGITLIGAENQKVARVSIIEDIGEEKDAQSKEILYGIGSVSKMFTTTAVMQLVDEGEINLDEPVTTYIPEFYMADERYQLITVRMLLNHSSGLMGSTYSNNILYEDNDTIGHDQLLRKLQTQRLKANPGQYSTYCNDGFILAELIVERLSGESFTDYLENHIFSPLEMVQSGTPLNRFNQESQVVTYFDESTLGVADYCNVIGTGGILSTAEELCKFGSAFTEENNGLLSKKALEEMSVPVSKTLKYGYLGEGGMENYGLGWDSIDAYPFNSYGVKAFMKGGDLIHQHAALLVVPEQNISVSVLSSGGNGMLNALLAEELAKIVLEEEGMKLEDNDLNESTLGQAEAKIPEHYLTYAGSYASSTGIYRLSFPEGKYLQLENCDAEIPKVQIYDYTSRDVFISRDEQYVDDMGMTSPSGLKSGTTRLRLSTETDGKQYIEVDSQLSYAEIGTYQLKGMFAEKMEVNAYGISKAWQKRDGKKYYLASEKYSSAFWMISPMVQINLSTQQNGYINASGKMTTAKVTGENNAESFVTLTGGTGRDLNDISILKQGEDEIVNLEDSSLFYIEEASIPVLVLSNEPIEFKQAGAKWYSIDGEAEGKPVNISTSEKAAVYVYNKYDTCIFSTYMKSRGGKVILPKEGKLVIVGEAGSTASLK